MEKKWEATKTTTTTNIAHVIRIEIPNSSNRAALSRDASVWPSAREEMHLVSVLRRKQTHRSVKYTWPANYIRVQWAKGCVDDGMCVSCKTEDRIMHIDRITRHIQIFYVHIDSPVQQLNQLKKSGHFFQTHTIVILMGANFASVFDTTLNGILSVSAEKCVNNWRIYG